MYTRASITTSPIVTAMNLNISLSAGPRLVLTTQVGTLVNGRNFKPLLEKADLPYTVRFHDLRHTCATLLLKKGTHPKIVQELLGHATVSITLDTYSHVLPGMDSEAAAGMEDLFS